MIYECSRCKKIFGTKYKYMRHINNVNQCKESDKISIFKVYELLKTKDEEISKLKQELDNIRNETREEADKEIRDLKNLLNFQKKELENLYEFTYFSNKCLEGFGISNNELIDVGYNVSATLLEDMKHDKMRAMFSEENAIKIFENPIDLCVAKLVEMTYFNISARPDLLLWFFDENNSKMIRLKPNKKKYEILSGNDMIKVIDKYFVHMINSYDYRLKRIHGTFADNSRYQCICDNISKIYEMKNSKLKNNCIEAIKEVASKNKSKVKCFWKLLKINIPDGF